MKTAGQCMEPYRFIGLLVHVEIDRPLGSRHPTHGFEYPVNYGFIPGEPAPDGEWLDAYVLGVSHAIALFDGRCIAVIHRLDDNDDKLVVVPDGAEFSDVQIRQAVNFQEQFFKSAIVRGVGYRQADG